MSYVLGRPLRARLVDTVQGHKKFAYACGNTLYDTNVNKERIDIPPYPPPFPIVPIIFQGRCVDVDRGRKVFAVASECHLVPPELQAGFKFVLVDDWPPYGVPNVLKFEFISLGGYPQAVQCLRGTDGCPYTYLYHDGGTSWVGTYAADGGTLTLTLQLLVGTQDPDRPLIDGWPVRYEWQLTISGCDGPTTVQARTTSYWPLLLGGQGLLLTSGCCPSATLLPADLAFAIYGYTAPYMPARLVGSERGHKQFYTSECCPRDTRCDVGCCGFETVPVQMTFTVAGVTDPGTPPPPVHDCTCINGTYTVTYATTSATSCQWTSTTVTGCGAWSLTCSTASGTVTLDFSGSLGAGDDLHYSMPLADWDPTTDNVLSFSSSSGVCTTLPPTITVSPV